MNANSINKIRSSLHHQANLKHSKSRWHKENTEFRLQEDEKCIQNLDIFSYHFEFCHVTTATTIIDFRQRRVIFNLCSYRRLSSSLSISNSCSALLHSVLTFHFAF